MADRNGAFEADHGAEKGGDHQRSMHPGRLYGRAGNRTAEPGQAGHDAAEQRQHAEKEQRQPGAGFQLGHLIGTFLFPA
jgi:hypothetical protein